jgi:hypothetical protein
MVPHTKKEKELPSSSHIDQKNQERPFELGKACANLLPILENHPHTNEKTPSS